MTVMDKKYIIFAFLLVVSGQIFAGKYKTDAVYNLISKSFTLNEDGSSDYRERKELKIYSTMTFDLFGETFIDYNPDFQTLTINEAYVLRKDGSKVETPQNAFNPMLPDNCTSCERLNQIRQMVVTHTALENEATIVLDYSIHSDNFFFRDLFENVQISENVAVERYEIKVSVPDDTPLSWKLNIGEINYEKSQSVANGRRVMEWMFYDVPSSATEEYLFKTAVPNLAFSSTNNLESPLFAIFRQQAFNEFEQPEIFSFFKNLVSDKSSDMDKILAVRDYIASNISEKSIKPQLINYLFASPQWVWTTNCALPVEKDMLLAGVLKSLGFTAQLAFDGNLLPEISSLVRVTLKDEVFYISSHNPDELNLSFELGDAYIILQDGHFEKIEKTPTNVEVEADITFSDGNIEDPKVNFLKKNVISPLTLSLISQDTVLSKVSTTNQGGYKIMRIYDGKYGTDLRSGYINRDRKNAINTKSSQETYIYHIFVPEKYRILTESSEETITVEGASMSIFISVDGQKIDIKRTLELPEQGLSAESSKKFKEMLGKWETKNRIVIK